MPSISSVVARPDARRALALAVSAALALPPPLAAQTAVPAGKGNGQATRVLTAPSVKRDDERVTLNFVNADIEQTIRAIGQFSGRQFVIDPRVKGTLTLVTERPVDKRQAYEQLLAALRLQGYTIVEPASAGGVARILPEADAKLQGGRVIGNDQAAPRGDQIVTQVFQLQHESATALVPVLRPLIAPNNTISAYPGNNTLVITDYADNLRRIAQIISAVDQSGLPDADVVPLKYALAVEIAATANKVLDEGARAAGQATDPGQRVTVLAEPRTNTLVVRAGSRSRLALARQFIERLDQPSSTPGNINVVYLRNAQAIRLAQTLRAVLAADPSFAPQVGGTGGLSAGGVTGQGQPGQPIQATQAQQAGGGTVAATGAGRDLAGMIQPDPTTNSLIITAPEPIYRNIRSIIEKLDARPAQVVIESLIVEVTADKAAEFGIQWQAFGNLNDSGYNVIGNQNFGIAGTNITNISQNLASAGTGLNLGVVNGSINIPGFGDVVNLAFLARALQTTANANILSMPNIQTLDNEEAKFLVGQNIPLTTGSFANTSVSNAAGNVNPFQTFERKDVGLQLKVKPQISEGGAVRLAIYVEVSSVAPGVAPTGQQTLNKRSFESNIVVQDGNFVVLSGLIDDQTTGREESVPLLGSIPLIGWLFRYDNRRRIKTNTMVFLRPLVIRDEATASNLAADRYRVISERINENKLPERFYAPGINSPEMPPQQELIDPRLRTPARQPNSVPVPEPASSPIKQ
ncbi:MAG: type II secretion system secretin GspD [Betaproteobacteria bacterium]